MTKRFDKNQIYGKWVHSEAEDSEDEVVLRPYESAPLSRGPKKIIEFKPGGKVTTSTTSADDRLNDSDGEWDIEDDNHINLTGGVSGFDGRLQISSLKNDKLTLKKKS